VGGWGLVEGEGDFPQFSSAEEAEPTQAHLQMKIGGLSRNPSPNPSHPQSSGRLRMNDKTPLTERI